MGRRGAPRKGPSALQLFFERHERALLYAALLPAALAYAWAVVCTALFPVVPYCVPPASLASAHCRVLGGTAATAALAAGAAVAGVGAAVALGLLAAPGSWSLHSAKNKVAALAALVAAASTAAQLAGVFARRGVAVNYAQLDAAHAFFAVGPGPAVAVALNASLYAPGTRLALSVRDLGADADTDGADVPAYSAFDMTAPLVGANITLAPAGPVAADAATPLRWTLAGLADGHRYLLAVVPATSRTPDNSNSSSTVVAHPQVAALAGTPLEALLRAAACPALRTLPGIKYVDMRLFHACRWDAATATCTPLDTRPDARCAFTP